MEDQPPENVACMEALSKFYDKPLSEIGFDDTFNWIAAWLAAKRYYQP